MSMVSNEVSRLRKVVVHRPDDGLERVTPERALEFLYDDICFLPEMQREHDVFTNTLSAVLGEDVILDTQKMLLDILKHDTSAREKLIDRVCEHENLKDYTLITLRELSVEDLCYTLFTGIVKESQNMLFAPLPNYVFTRDIGVVINDHLIICQAAKKARTRETILSRCIFYNHDAFKPFWQNDKIVDLTQENKDITIEGGDLMTFSKDYLFVGKSERTSNEAITWLKELLFERGIIDNLVKIEIPANRSYMHIDTVFTQISHTEFVLYAPLLLNEELVQITVYNKHGDEKEYPHLEAFLNSIIENPVFISCGNGISPFDEREQWTDGCNLVALRPGLAVAYRRNKYTAAALQDQGYTIMKAETFLKLNETGDLVVDDLGKFIFTLPSAELSRARGGPHCMTMPVQRS